ncbi:MAG: DUF2318 domain-containing protein [Campylobacter sp.]|nr:DUF2318 domain-containing protein [Campylobacter sp.]
MSLYFVHFLTCILPLSIVISLICKNYKNIFKQFLAVFLGFLFAYFAFFIAASSLQTQNLLFNVNFAFVFCLFLSLVFYFWQKVEIFSLILTFMLSFCIALQYYFLSQDFPIFSTSLLDSTAISSLAFIVLAIGICILFFFFLRGQEKSLASFILFIFVLVLELDKILASIFLTLMRENFIPTDDFMLSFVAKSLYFSAYSVYVYLIFIMILAFLSLKKLVKNTQKMGFLDINFRKNIAHNALVYRYFFTMLFATLLSFCVLLYFHTISSRPLKIDEPTEILPNNEGFFVFDVSEFRDNKLHRFAYVSEQGKVIRFFILNKREDRDSPVAVFDACMICGDMGYIKKDGELICISCNVRIFLPSVGKAGGCNPIPLEFNFDGQKISIALKNVEAGSNYFNQIKEIEVKDPVSKEKLINLKAPFSYTYKGIIYYFTNEKNYEEFKKDPQKYTDDDKEARFMIQRRDDVN